MVELDKSYIRNAVQTALNKVFSEGERRRILDRHDRLEFCCPVCGDSSSDAGKKRGNLFFKNLHFKCFRRDCSLTFTSLCRKFSVPLDPDKKLAFLEYIERRLSFNKSASDAYVIESLDKMIPMDRLREWFDSGAGFLTQFRPAQRGGPVHQYFASRKVPNAVIESEIWEGMYSITDRWKVPVSAFVNQSDSGKVLGMQVRNLKEGRDRMFKIYNFEHLYNSTHDEPVDETEAVSYNKVSYMFNILRTDFDRPVTVFEGLSDSWFFPNSIGAVGVNTDFTLLTGADIDLRFFFDNDDAGDTKTAEYFYKGHKVFLWEKLIADVANRRGRDPYWDAKIMRNVKDLNKLAMSAPSPYKSLGLEKYFSNGWEDARWIRTPKAVKKVDFVQERKNALVQKVSAGSWEELTRMVDTKIKSKGKTYEKR